MSKRKTGFLEDHHGNPSSMRLRSITSLVASIVFGLMASTFFVLMTINDLRVKI